MEKLYFTRSDPPCQSATFHLSSSHLEMNDYD